MARRPNVILVLTDDQGYGDLGCTGNPWIQTPYIDQFYQESIRFSDFHVQPLCTPTRGALMTGRRPLRNGAWATCWGRSILKRDETTMADIFRANGYRTGLFGKWHLGDNYPYRPFERGFERVVAHQGGGVGQTPDFWGNNYFDDTYFANGQARQYVGYCTDVWFEQALEFMEEAHDEPFFCTIATNAPHSPYLVADEYAEQYRGNPDIPEPEFYGMITNIDKNFGRLRAWLQENNLADDTVLIFMTDNGSSGGSTADADGHVKQGYNAGMRGKKGSYYDGGHRVPFFLRYPAAELAYGRDVEAMALDIDLLPTLIDLCRLDPPAHKPFDGLSLVPAIHGKEGTLADRVHFLQYHQNENPPAKWTNAIMTPRWRLIHGVELYDIKGDPAQEHDVSAQHPQVVEALRAAHEYWWDEVAVDLAEPSPIVLGNAAENPARLCSMDVMGDVAWHQGHIVAAVRSAGRWHVEFESPGEYTFRLRRWPESLPIPMNANVSAAFAERCVYPGAARVSISVERARLALFGEEYAVDVDSDAEEVVIACSVEQTGTTTLQAWFGEADGEERGAYYLIVERAC